MHKTFFDVHWEAFTILPFCNKSDSSIYLGLTSEAIYKINSDEGCVYFALLFENVHLHVSLLTQPVKKKSLVEWRLMSASPRWFKAASFQCCCCKTLEQAAYGVAADERSFAVLKENKNLALSQNLMPFCLSYMCLFRLHSARIPDGLQCAL